MVIIFWVLLLHLNHGPKCPSSWACIPSQDSYEKRILELDSSNTQHNTKILVMLMNHGHNFACSILQSYVIFHVLNTSVAHNTINSSSSSFKRKFFLLTYKIILLINNCFSCKHLCVEPCMFRDEAGKSPIMIVRPFHHRSNTDQDPI